MLRLNRLTQLVRLMHYTIESLPPQQRHIERVLLFPLDFLQLIVHRSQNRISSMFLSIIVLVTLGIFPIFLLLYMQMRFLPYQDETITLIHQITITSQVLSFCILCHRVAHELNVSIATRSWRIITDFTMRFPLFFSFALLSVFLIVPAVWLVAVVPGSWADRQIVANLLNPTIFDDWWTEGKAMYGAGAPKYLRRYLYIVDAPIAKAPPSNEAKSAYIIREGSSLNAWSDVESLDLSGRSLRYAWLSLSTFHNVNLRGADLSGANLIGTKLKGVNLSSATLNGTWLKGVELENALLRRAILHGADLRGAHLYGANLVGAELHGSMLMGVKLHGTNLSDTEIYGSNISSAELYGVNLERAKMYGSVLTDSKLLGVNLSGAELTGVDLSVTELKFSYFVNSVVNPKERSKIAEDKIRQGWRVWQRHAGKADLSMQMLEALQGTIVDLGDLVVDKYIAKVVKSSDGIKMPSSDPTGDDCVWNGSNGQLPKWPEPTENCERDFIRMICSSDNRWFVSGVMDVFAESEVFDDIELGIAGKPLQKFLCQEKIACPALKAEHRERFNKVEHLQESCKELRKTWRKDAG